MFNIKDNLNSFRMNTIMFQDSSQESKESLNSKHMIKIINKEKESSWT